MNSMKFRVRNIDKRKTADAEESGMFGSQAVFGGFVPVIAPQSVLLVSHADHVHYSQILEKAYTVLIRRPQTQPKTPSTMNSPAYGYTADTLEKYIKAKEERFRVTGVRSTIVPVTRTGMETEIKHANNIPAYEKYIKAKEERFCVTGVRSTIVPVTRTGMEKEIKQTNNIPAYE
jgi:alkaline phosphatase